MPAPTLTFYKMPVQTAVAATPAAFQAALFASGSSANDYRGTPLPASHQWAWTADGSGLATAARAPAGTMAFRPGLVWFNPAAAGSWTYLAPDSTLTANDCRCSITKDSGAYTTYDSATPYTNVCPGSWGWGPPALITTASVRVQVYVSQEVILVDAWSSNTAHSFSLMGAVAAPHTESPGETCESDGRLYGAFNAGCTFVIASNFLEAGGTFPMHDLTNREAHGMVFLPGTPNFLWTCGKDTRFIATPNLQQTDLAGRYIRRPITLARSTGDAVCGGVAVGTLREVYYFGSGIAGQTRRNGATDLFHLVGYNSNVAGACLALNAAA